MSEQVKIFNTETSEAADELLAAHKQLVDIKDRVECCRKHLAGLLIRDGLRDKQHIVVDDNGVMKKLTLKEGKVSDASVSISTAKQ